MNILMVAMSLDIGGAETHIVELCKGLTALGHKITIASNGGAYERDLENINLIHLPLNKRRPIAILKSYFGLKKLIKNSHFDIVHAHARIPAFICGLIHRKYDFRFTTTAHLDFKITPLLKLMSNWGEKTLSVSKDIKEYLIKNYKINEENISLTINGIDTNTFTNKAPSEKIIESFGLHSNTKKIVSISRLDNDRSLAAIKLIEVAPDLYQKFNIEIIIVGDGNDYSVVKEKADIANQKIGKDIIHLTGARTDIADIISIADVFIGVSRAALEAMSCGKPVILAGNQGYLGIFSNNVLDKSIETNFCCRNCEETNATNLFNDCIYLLSADNDEINKLGDYNRQIVIENYSTSRMVNDYISFYKSLEYPIDFKNPDVIISGYYGFHNQGDDTLVNVLSQEIHKSNQFIKVSALANKPKEFKKAFNINAINRLNIFKYYSKVRHAKLLISGGGTLLQDATSTKSLYYYLCIIKLAQISKVKTFIYANGIGPISSKKNIKFVKKILNNVDKITVRTPKDKDYLKSIGFCCDNVIVSADPAYLLKPQTNFNSTSITLKNDKKYFAISIRETVTSNYDENMFEENIVHAIKTIVSKYNLTPIFIPMQPKYDIALSNRVLKKIGTGEILTNITPNEICYLFSKMEFVIGMRLHALIFASKMAVPMIGITYDPKVDDLLDYLKVGSPIKIDNNISSAIINSIDNLYCNYIEIKDNLKKAVKEFEKLAIEDAQSIMELINNSSCDIFSN